MNFHPMRVLAVACVALGSVACGGLKTNKEAPPVMAIPDPTPVLSASPTPGPFNGSITVVLTANIEAEILATLDGSDPHLPSATRITGQDELDFPISQNTVITAFARTAAGEESTVQTFAYVLAGGYVGTATGQIIVGDVAAGDLIGLQVDGNLYETFPALAHAGIIDFVVTGLASGSHTFTAAADRNGDGQFTQLLDYFSTTVSVTIDTSNPFQASAQGIQLYLGASQSGLCTIEGNIDAPGAALGQSVRVSALDSSSLSGLTGGLTGGTTGSTTGAQSLLTELTSGYQVFAMPGSTIYPYAITNLQPGSYVVIPVITSIGQGGFGMDLLVNPFSPINCAAGQVVKANFAFGADNLAGTVTTPAGAGIGGLGFGYGMVAARSVSLTTGIQALLMPTIVIGGGSGAPTGSYGGVGLLDTHSYSERAYTSLDSNSSTTAATGGPIIEALLWAINPLSTDPAQATFTATGNMTENVTTM